MGKQQATTYPPLSCKDDLAPICDNNCCKISHEGHIKYNVAIASNFDSGNHKHNNHDDTTHELLVIGAGIH